MSYMSCPRCGLKANRSAAFPASEYCPRCLANGRVAVPMQASGRQPWAHPSVAPSIDRPRVHRDQAA
jgi:late competence protein required for DNA uptake (superfamily II DNA/RNA helicase)